MSAVDDLVGRGFDGRELVVCRDGPRSGAWYFLDDWRNRRRIAAEVDHETPYVGSVLGYVAGTAFQPHPRNDRVQGHVLTWAPELADAALRHQAREAASRHG